MFEAVALFILVQGGSVTVLDKTNLVQYENQFLTSYENLCTHSPQLADGPIVSLESIAQYKFSLSAYENRVKEQKLFTKKMGRTNIPCGFLYETYVSLEAYVSLLSLGTRCHESFEFDVNSLINKCQNIKQEFSKQQPV